MKSKIGRTDQFVSWTGKVLEKLINKSLQAELERVGAIHANQYGFRKAKEPLMHCITSKKLSQQLKQKPTKIRTAVSL